MGILDVGGTVMGTGALSRTDRGVGALSKKKLGPTSAQSQAPLTFHMDG